MSLLRFLRRRGHGAESAWTLLGDDTSPERSSKEFYPLVDTLRLYAGWLLAWYFVIYAFGAYQFTRGMFDWDLLEQLFLSTLILQFSCLAFLFLLLSQIHRVLGRGIVKGVLLTIAGVAMFVLFRANI